MAGEKRGAAHPADGGGDTVLGEADSSRGQRIEIWCFHNRISGAAEGVEAPVIRIKDDDIRLCSFGVSTPKEGRCGDE